jgi:hypothetical protein
MQVYNFMKKYQEQEQLQGFKYVLNEIMKLQVFNASNVKLSAMLTLDFPEYIKECQRAQQRFFQDQMAKPSQMQLNKTSKRLLEGAPGIEIGMSSFQESPAESRAPSRRKKSLNGSALV